MQLTVITHLNRRGTKRAQIESVHVCKDFQGQGLGKKFMDFAEEKAKELGCGIVQLTTDKTRLDAHRFYQNLGFEDSHVGMKKFI